MKPSAAFFAARRREWEWALFQHWAFNEPLPSLRMAQTANNIRLMQEFHLPLEYWENLDPLRRAEVLGFLDADMKVKVYRHNQVKG